MFYSIKIIGRNPHRRLQTPVHAPTSHPKITTGLNRFLLIEFDGLSQNHDHEILSQNSNSLPFQSRHEALFFRIWEKSREDCVVYVSSSETCS